MPVVVILGLLGVACLPHMRSALRRGGDDVPARIIAAATDRLPARLREWGWAMGAELSQIPGRADRWRFAVGVLRVALFPPARHCRRVLVTALAALAVTAGVTGTVVGTVPPATVFAASLGLLLGGCVTVATWRSAWDGWTPRQTITAAAAGAAVTAAVTGVAWVAVSHPAVFNDSEHVPAYSVVLAVLLGACLVAALSLPRGAHAATVLWWGLGGTLASGAIDVAATAAGLTGAQFSGTLAAALAGAALASARTGSRPAGIRTGLLVTALSAPTRFAVEVTALLRVNHYALTDSYDVAAFPHSGYPDAASYLLSDALAGAVLSGMLIYSVLTIAATLLGAAVGARPSRPGLLGDG